MTSDVHSMSYFVISLYVCWTYAWCLRRCNDVRRSYPNSVAKDITLKARFWEIKPLTQIYSQSNVFPLHMYSLHLNVKCNMIVIGLQLLFNWPLFSCCHTAKHRQSGLFLSNFSEISNSCCISRLTYLTLKNADYLTKNKPTKCAHYKT